MPTINATDITFDKIRAWLNDSDAVDLPATERKIYERWDYAYDCLKTEKRSVVVNRLVKKFGISKEQAYRDIRSSIKLLNPRNRHDTEWLRNYIIEDALTHIEVAKSNLDMVSWQKARTDLIKIYISESKENEGIDTELLGRNNYFVAVNFGGAVEKINLNQLDKIPIAERVKKTDFLFSEIKEEDAEILMNS